MTDGHYLRQLQEEQRRRLGQPEDDGEAGHVAQLTEDRAREAPRAIESGDDRTKATTHIDSESSKRAPPEPEPVNSRLREDPSNPGTYTGYSRNPPAPRPPKQ